MAEHLSSQAAQYLKRPVEERIYFIKERRWIAYNKANDALRAFDELLVRPPSIRAVGMTLCGPYMNGKTIIVERFALQHLRSVQQQKVWVVQTGEGAGLGHFFNSILRAFNAPMTNNRTILLKTEQLHRLFTEVKPRILFFDEFHSALRGRKRDIDAIFAFLRRLGREYDISSVLVGEVAVYDYINSTAEMASRFPPFSLPRWKYDEEYLALLDGLELAMPLARPSNLSDEPIARRVFALSEALIGEIVTIVGAAAIAAIRDGSEQITAQSIDALRYVPLSMRKNDQLRDEML